MTISALDLSLTATGWARSENGLVSFGTIDCGKRTGMERLDWVHRRACDAVQGSKLVVIEGPVVRSTAAVSLGMLHGVVQLSLWSRGLPVVLVAPQSLKKFVIGHGGSKKNPATKSMMLMEVFKRWGHTGANDNEADAIGLLYIGMALRDQWNPTLEAQRQVLEKLHG